MLHRRGREWINDTIHNRREYRPQDGRNEKDLADRIEVVRSAFRPKHGDFFMAYREVDLDGVRHSYLRNAVESLPEGARPGAEDIEFLAVETRMSADRVEEILDDLARETG